MLCYRPNRLYLLLFYLFNVYHISNFAKNGPVVLEHVEKRSKDLSLFRVTKFSGEVMSLRSVYTVKVVCRRYGMYHIGMTNQVSRRGEPRGMIREAHQL